MSGDTPLPRESWRRIRGWYRAAVDHDPTPAQIKFERITAERVELYSNVTHPLVENIPTSVPPSQIYDSIPTEEDIKWAVWRLQGASVGGALPDVCQAPPGVATRSSVAGRSVRSGGQGSDVKVRGER